MKPTQAIATVLTLATGAAAGSATIMNSCKFPIYAWSIGDTNGPRNTIQPGEAWSEEFYSKKDGGGPSIKITTTKSLDQATSLTQLEYTSNDKLWYDLSNIDLGHTGAAPFAGHVLDLVPSYEACNRIICPAETPVCNAAYNAPNDVRTSACGGDTDLFLEVCQPAVNAKKSFKNLKSLVAAPVARSVKLEVAAPHVHRGLGHVHERIRRSRIFNRR